ncbi:hypothetical protein QO014_000887 [Kaistia dalseonensis]|uniref:LysR substrate-binding domain-containing protein n=1 Tax=Kaistia dalseonensis TaxID=410840 RepID=A0ABU0H2L1_9HYPH|nr:hypothetical protein [Kaistia dalseonensis]
MSQLERSGRFRSLGQPPEFPPGRRRDGCFALRTQPRDHRPGRKLGVRLFNRATRSVSLTQAGARPLARRDPVLQDLDQALDTLSDERGTPSGTLRINANKSGARILLKNVVPRFLDLYPDVELDLVSKGRLADIAELGFEPACACWRPCRETWSR